MNQRRLDKLRYSTSLNFGVAGAEVVEALLTPVTEIALVWRLHYSETLYGLLQKRPCELDHTHGNLEEQDAHQKLAIQFPTDYSGKVKCSCRNGM